MDLSKISAQVKGFQRRTTQKVLQQMGIADKTEDESLAYQNFVALGSFTSQLKTTIQASDTCFEKTCTAQTHLAGQIQSYLHSELSGDADLPPGELNDFFSKSDASRQHADMLQQVAGKFYAACSELGNNALQAVVGQLNDLVVRPIMNDEDFANVTKDILEDKKKATLDYDSYRRAAQNSSSPDYDRAEAKLRMAKERYEQTSRRLAEHIDQRNQIRCKLLVHGILTAIQQYCNYHAHAFNILRDTATSLKPLLDVYQMSDDQLQVTINLDTPYHSQADPARAKSPPKGHSATAAAADSLFGEQNHGGRPKAPTSKAAANHGRGASPQLDEMMRENLNLKKPAPPVQKNAAPMNTYGTTSKPSPQPSHQPPQSNPPPQQTQQQFSNSPQPVHHASQQNPQPSVNLFGSSGLSPPIAHSPTPPPSADILIDLNVEASFIDDPLQSNGNTFAPPIQPSNIDPFASFSTPPIKPTQPPPTTNNSNNFFNTNTSPSAPPTNNNSNNNNNNFFNSNDPFASFTSPQPTKPQPPSNTNNDPFAAFTSQTAKNAPSAGKSPMDDFSGNLMFNSPPQPTAQPQRPSPVSPAPIKHGSGQEERHELNPAVTQRINNWASKGGRSNNLRALLSTLHEVIWTDSGWDALSLADVLTPAQVKKAYIRANLIVHPDKVQTGTVEQQLIAQRLFEALRVSYEAFKAESQ